MLSVLRTSTVLLKPTDTQPLREYAEQSAILWNGRVERGLMVCHQKHQSINADVNGAVNILKVAVNRTIALSTDFGFSGSRLLAEPLLLRWNYHEWR